MKIATYNILDGCERDPDRLSRLGAWLSSQAYDILALNELKGWIERGQMPSVPHEWGYPYGEILGAPDSRYAIGLIAKRPFHVVARDLDGFHHGLLQVRVGDVTVLVTHLTPRAAVERRAEAARIAERVASIEGPVVVLGDLNTLSPLDRDLHEEAALAERMRQIPLLRSKFLIEGEIDYTPMQTLLDAGLTDAGAADTGPTVPTRMNVDPAHRLSLRLDFVLHRGLDTAVTYTVPRGEPVDHLSDHYPVECRWA